MTHRLHMRYLTLLVLLVALVVAPAAQAAGASGAISAASAKGSVIVFQVSSGGSIYAVDPSGANLRYLTHGMDPAVSPDGKWVVFTRWDGVQNGITGSLWVINVNGKQERQVMSGALQPKSPTWSPDGERVVISMQQGGTVDKTWVCFIGGGEVMVITPPAGARCRPNPADPYWGLREVNVATGAYEDLPDSTHSFAPTWDPANPWHIVYRGDRGLMSLDLNLGTTWLVQEGASQRGPVFSPNGKRIATTFKQNDHWEVHVMNADGSGEVRITQTPVTVIMNQRLQGKEAISWNNAAPAWSPDGKQVAYITDRRGAYEMWVMNADGSGQRPLVSAAALGGAQIKYDGVDERVISWR